MNYTYKTNFATLKKVYQIAKKIGLQNIFHGSEIDIDLEKISTQLLENDVIKDFCQTITGSDVDFEDFEIDELEGVILGFFDATRAKLEKLNLVKTLKQTQ